MHFPVMHLPTLLTVTGIAMAFSGAALALLARGRDRDYPAVAFWSLSMIVGAAGIVLLSAGAGRGTPPFHAGNVLIMVGAGLSWAGARVFAGRKPHAMAMLAGPFAYLALRALPLGAAGLLCTILVSCFAAAYTLAAATEFWSVRAEPLRSRAAAIVLLSLHAAVHAARAVSLVLSPRDDLFPPGIVAQIMVFEALLHTIGMAFVLLAIMRERAELHATLQLRQLALLDGLTGLGNRRQFDEALERELQRAVRDRAPLALLMIDADHFKAYNDTYGHQSGDTCLRAVAAALRAALHRPGDVAVRYGGEEFAVLLPGTDEAGAAMVADAIHAGIAALRIEHRGSPHGAVGVSIGAASVTPEQGTQADKLVRAADRALYAAKDAGRNRTAAAQPAGLIQALAAQAGAMQPMMLAAG